MHLIFDLVGRLLTFSPESIQIICVNTKLWAVYNYTTFVLLTRLRSFELRL